MGIIPRCARALRLRLRFAPLIRFALSRVAVELRSSSPQMSFDPASRDYGAMGIRTPDLLNAIEALYQLSYDPV